MDIQFYCHSVVYYIANIKYDMTDIERERVESSGWIVSAVVSRLRPKDEDLSQSIYLYLCYCAKRYDETRGVKWTTYAFKNAYYYGLMLVKEECQREYKLCYDIPEEILADEDIEADIDNISEINELCNNLNEIQKTIIELKYAGYKNNEIRKELGLGKNTYFKEIKKIHQVARKLKGVL